MCAVTQKHQNVVDALPPQPGLCLHDGVERKGHSSGDVGAPLPRELGVAQLLRGAVVLADQGRLAGEHHEAAGLLGGGNKLREAVLSVLSQAALLKHRRTGESDANEWCC